MNNVHKIEIPKSKYENTFLFILFQPLQQSEWYGNPKGYNITYKKGGANETSFSIIDDHTANSHVLTNLEEWSLYEIQMTAINEVGTSDASPTATERTREAGNFF